MRGRLVKTQRNTLQRHAAGGALGGWRLTGVGGSVFVRRLLAKRTGGILRNPSRSLEQTSEDEARRRMSTSAASQEHTQTHKGDNHKCYARL